MRDPEDFGLWALTLGMCLCGLILLAGLALLIAGAWASHGDKRECRRTGGQVVKVDESEWRCQMPEAKP